MPVSQSQGESDWDGLFCVCVSVYVCDKKEAVGLELAGIWLAFLSTHGYSLQSNK